VCGPWSMIVGQPREKEDGPDPRGNSVVFLITKNIFKRFERIQSKDGVP
jgi:hypothetical protein